MKSNRVLGRGLNEIRSTQPESTRLKNMIGNPVTELVAPKDPAEMTEEEYNKEVAAEISKEFDITDEDALKLVEGKYKDLVATAKSEEEFPFVTAEDIADKEDLEPKDSGDDFMDDDDDLDDDDEDEDEDDEDDDDEDSDDDDE